jgi:hypothetical protein
MEDTLLLRLITHRTGLQVSVDELVLSLQQLMATHGLPGLLGLLLQVVDQDLLAAWRAGALAPPACCPRPAWEVEGVRRRTLKTSLGTVPFAWHRLRCRRCRARWIPLRVALHLAARQRHSAELEQRVLEAVRAQSYRQVARTLAAHGGVGKSTVQAWVHATGSTTLADPTDPDAVLEVDGMVYSAHPQTVGGSTHGDLRVALGVTPAGGVTVRGLWSGPAWQVIGAQLAGREGGRVTELVHDGEPGLADGVGVAAVHCQRCHRHLATKLDNALWADHLSRPSRRCWQQALAVMLAVPLPADPTDARQRAAVRQVVRVTQQGLQSLVAELQAQGAEHAATYLQRALPEVFSYVAAWLETGRRLPRTTALIEGGMSQLAVRIKAIGRNWTARGVTHVAGIILLCWKHLHDWKVYWARKQHLTGHIQMACTISKL